MNDDVNEVGRMKLDNSWQIHATTFIPCPGQIYEGVGNWGEGEGLTHSIRPCAMIPHEQEWS